MFLTLILVFLSFLSLVTLTIYSMTPFIFMIFLTIVTFVLGLLLIVNNLFFAGAVLMIVNAGAIAMVFLFVCVLSSRKMTVTRSTTFFMTLLNSFLFLFFFSMALVFFSYGGQTFYLHQDFTEVFSPFSDVYVSDLLSFSDWSVASHLLLMENNMIFPNILFFIGIFLLVSMCVAMLITKRTLKSGF